MPNLHGDRDRSRGLLALLLGGRPHRRRSRRAAAATPAVYAQAGRSTPWPITSRIAAVVNGDVISEADIANRARLFAISTGLPMSPEVIDRLRPQILRQLIDERLRVQEAQRRKIVIQDAQIAAAIKDIETRNNMPAGALRAKLASDGRQQSHPDRPDPRPARLDADAAGDRRRKNEHHRSRDRRTAEAGRRSRSARPEYRLGEIFIPVDDRTNSADAQRFAETVITELHAGAPFAMVAAQFSQTQTALEGGELGWEQTNQLDPAVARLVAEMPVGAVSNPVRVPGGSRSSTCRPSGKSATTSPPWRRCGRRSSPFTAPLTDPQNPTEQQRQALAKAKSVIASVNGCEQMEAVAKANNAPNRPIDPGEIRVEGVNPPAFRTLLETIPHRQADGAADLPRRHRGHYRVLAGAEECR